MGVPPGPLTLRELLAMAEGRIEQQWNHTAALLAMLANVHRDPKKGRAFKPADFHPTVQHKTPARAALKADLKVLKSVFVDRPCARGSSSS